MNSKMSFNYYHLGFWMTFICLTKIAGGAWLRCYKGSIDKFVVSPLGGPMHSSFTSCLDTSLPTVVYTFGYRGRTNGPATTAVLNAYINKKKNVILLDWEEEARSGLLGIPLGYALSAVPNAKKIGKELGEALKELLAHGVNMTQLHLMGHSLGAHIMGYAGKRARQDGFIVDRITGLDPARALYEGTLAINSGLDRTCARFVDIVHSDPGGYGTSTATGTVDIWPNYSAEPTGTLQPGCPTGNFDMFSPEDLCSHDRSWHYYVEAIASPTAFPAAFASDGDAWYNSRGQTNYTVYLGDLTNTRARGNFFLTTNSSPKYGKGTDGLNPDRLQASKHPRNSTLTKILVYLR